MIDHDNDYAHSLRVDSDYMMIAAHVDEGI